MQSSEEPVLSCVLDIDGTGGSTATRCWSFTTGCVDSVDLLQPTTSWCLGQRQPVDGAVALAVGPFAGCRGRGDARKSLSLEEAEFSQVEGRHAGCIEDVFAEDRYGRVLDGGEVEGNEILGKQVQDRLAL